MLCDLCGKNEANVHLTEIIDGEARELHLCQACAHEKGISASDKSALGGLLAGLTDLGTKEKTSKAAGKLSCPRCGMTYEDFRKSGRLGCGSCYTAFRALLSPLLRRIHGSIRHVGKSPAVVFGPKKKGRVSAGVKRQDEMTRLKAQLKKAVAMEAFEQAAHLRDRIKALKPKPRKVKKHGSSG